MDNSSVFRWFFWILGFIFVASFWGSGFGGCVRGFRLLISFVVSLAKFWSSGRQFELAPKGKNGELTYTSRPVQGEQSLEIRFSKTKDGLVKMNLIGGKLEAQINKSKDYPNYHYYIPSGSLSKTMGFIELHMGGGMRAYNR